MKLRLFGWRARQTPREKDAGQAGPAPDERLGPEPPPPRTFRRPGVTVHVATAVVTLERGPAWPGASRLGPLGTSELDDGLSWAAVVLSGESSGDVVVAPDGGVGLPGSIVTLLEGAPSADTGKPLIVPRDALVGKGVPGITGARVVARTAAHSILRLGPPPAARWAVVGLRSVAVFTGKLTLFDGDEEHDVRAGSVAFVADPSATLYLQAGNDTAVAIALATPEVLVRLG